ncbi:aminopeptidase [Pseudochryseolinea flava]|uniref:Aminopeptidase n=1 Tax=Pseudochryseolinea flava TaxID=2059302 RepID=A0A364XVT8_9BACT|nr:aminopeptidase [Pseudochryseolinea flava]RAV98296.1 aminopeptidase [Pseudochryseolinea flava]
MKGKIKKWIKRALWGLLGVIAILVLIYWELVSYGVQQGYGQMNIIWNARPVEEFLADPNFPDSLKARLNLIQDVRRFATDSLGLKDTENYKTMYDQKGEEIMWVVMASEPFELKHKEWKFPVIGSVPYKGFFNKERAFTLKQSLEKEGFDVIVRNPGGWSTLGWFTDPILSKMLNRSEGDLANLIIHEMSHATIFVKDSIDFNENLATFIGDRGAERFLIAKYGEGSKEYRDYINEDKDYVKYVNHMLRGAHALDSIYKSMRTEDPVEQKKRIKNETIKMIVTALDTLTLDLNKKPSERFKEKLPNNAYFMNFRQYQAKQNDFWEEYNGAFGGDLKKYIAHLSTRYPFL